MVEFQQLPEEILLDILVSLQVHDLLACSTVCKRLQHLFKHSTLLQLVVELAVQGLRLRTHTDLRDDDGSAMDILSAFRRSRKAWGKIEPFTTAMIPMSRVEYEICDRVFAHGLMDQNEKFKGIEFNGLEVHAKKETRSIPVWKTLENTGVHILDYSFDVSCDLIAIVEDPDEDPLPGNLTRIFLMTMTEGRPHPEAAITCLSLPQLRYWDHCDIKIVDSYLAILFREGSHFGEDEGTLLIWNWRTGSKVYERESIGGYAFLSPNILFLFVYIHNSNMVPLAGIELLHLDQPTADVFLGFRFNKPPFEVTVLSDKPTVDSPSIPKNVPLSPFVLEETAERIVVVQFEDSLLFITCRALLRILQDETIKPVSKKPSKLPYKRVFKWDQWGPDNTFWLRKWGVWPGFTAVSGARFCSIVETSQPLFVTNNDLMNLLDSSGKKEKRLKEKESEDDEELDGLVLDLYDESLDPPYREEEKSILILDFNPRPILRASIKPGETEESTKSEENGEMSLWKRFRKRTKALKWGSKTSTSQPAKIPFRAYQRPVRRNYTDMILTIDHVIGIVDDETAYDVLQFVE